VDKTDEGVRLSFDGRPLPERLLRDPYQALFDEAGQEAERGRELAVGILAALRMGGPVVVVSGEGLKRLRLEIFSPERDRLSAGGAGSGTLIEARLAGRSAGDVLARVREACRLLKSSLTVCGREVVQGPDPGGLPFLAFQDQTCRGFMVIRPRAKESVIHLYKQGVRVCSVTRHPLPAVEAHVDDDAFRLTASQAGVVKDGRFQAATRVDRERLRGLASAAAERYLTWFRTLEQERLPEAVFSGAESLWRGRVSNLVSLTGAWLRDAASDQEPLWSAPLYLSADRRPLSLRDIDAQCRAKGFVPVSNRPAAETDKDTRIVWRLDEADGSLDRLFKGKVRRWRYTDIARRPSRATMLLGALLALPGFALFIRAFPVAIGAHEPRSLLEFGLLAVMGGCFLLPGALIFTVYGVMGGGLALRYFWHEVLLPLLVTLLGVSATLAGLNPASAGRLVPGFLIDVAAALLWTRAALRLWRDR
jgi:hypothetical protein